MRLWLSLTTVLVVLLSFLQRGDAMRKTKRGGIEDHMPLDPCPTNNICLIFGDDKCDVHDVKYDQDGVQWDDVVTKGYIWEMKDSPRCENGDYGHVYARLNIEPLNATNWRISATLIASKDPAYYAPEDFKFNFGKSELSFLSDGTQFTYNKRDTLKQSDKSLAKSDSIRSRNSKWIFWGIDHGLNKYIFDVDADGEKLLDFVESKVICTVEQRKKNEKSNIHKFELNDADFLEKFNLLTNCDVSDINEICYDTCDKIFSDSNSPTSTDSIESSSDSSKPSRTTNCPSNLWYHSPSKGEMLREWTKISELECNMGWWQGNTTDGVKKIDRSLEVQCSAMEPNQMTTMAWIVGGVTTFIGFLVLVGGIALIVYFCFCKKRRMHGGETEKKFTIRDSDSKAQTPGGKSTEREKV